VKAKDRVEHEDAERLDGEIAAQNAAREPSGFARPQAIRGCRDAGGSDSGSTKAP